MPPTRNAPSGSSSMAAVTMTISFKYRCPPGTGMLNELSAMFIAMNTAQTVIHFVGCD